MWQLKENDTLSADHTQDVILLGSSLQPSARTGFASQQNDQAAVLLARSSLGRSSVSRPSPLRGHFLDLDGARRGGHQCGVASLCDPQDSFDCANAVDDSS